MSLVLGTNCGFVTTAPSADPAVSNSGIDNDVWGQKDASPSDATKVTEIGFWLDSQGDDELNFEVGIYTDDGGGSSSVPVTLLSGSDKVNVLPTGNGIWVSVTGLNITISGSTIYWISVQVDNTSITVFGNYGGSGSRNVVRGSSITLPDPTWNGGSYFSSILAVYAVYETGGAVELAGSSDAVSTTSAPVKVSRKIVGSSDAVSAVSAPVKVSRKIAGSSDAISNLSGAIKRLRKISGSADGLSTTQGLLKALRKIVGSSDAVSTAGGTLTIIGYITLSGSADAVSSLTGAIKRACKLIGSSDAVSDVTGNIVLTLKLSGSTDAAAVVDGILALALKLAGSIDALSVVGGTLVVSTASGLVMIDRAVFKLDNSRREFVFDANRRNLTLDNERRELVIDD